MTSFMCGSKMAAELHLVEAYKCFSLITMNLPFESWIEIFGTETTKRLRSTKMDEMPDNEPTDSVQVAGLLIIGK